MNDSRDGLIREAFIVGIVANAEEIASSLYDWLDKEVRVLEVMEEAIIGAMRRLGRGLAQRACATKVPRYPAGSVWCGCVREAEYASS